MYRLTHNTRGEGEKMPTHRRIPASYPRTRAGTLQMIHGRMLDDTVAAQLGEEQGRLGVRLGFCGPENLCSAGVWGGFTPNGIVVGHMLFFIAGRPADVVVGLRHHLQVRRLCACPFPLLYSPMVQKGACRPDRE